MTEIRVAREPIVASLVLPGSKSYTNRALAVAALADGLSRIDGALFSDDTEHMAASLNRLGIRVDTDPCALSMTVVGRGGEIPAAGADLFCGNAGTALRFLLPICALGRGRFVIDGNQRMRQRPQGPLLAALNTLGVAAKARYANDCPPVILDADGCPGGLVTMDGSLSSQYFSALAIAAPCMSQGMTMHVEGELVSKPYLDITADVMAAFGASLSNVDYRYFMVPAGQTYHATHYQIEPDASTASYFFAAAALTGGRVTVRGLHRDSRQGDVGFVELLERMGCRVDDEPEGLTVTGTGELHGLTVDMNALSDTALTLAAMAPFCDSPVEIRNIEHARRQESDRVAVMATELARLGIRVTEFADGWRIEPGMPTAGAIETYDDHRVAMSFSLLGLRVPGIQIRDPQCVAKTFPAFFARFGALTAPGLA